MSVRHCRAMAFVGYDIGEANVLSVRSDNILGFFHNYFYLKIEICLYILVLYVILKLVSLWNPI